MANLLQICAQSHPICFMKHHNIYFVAVLILGPTVYPGKYFISGTCNDAKARSQHSIISAKGTNDAAWKFAIEDNLIEEEDDRCAEEPQ